MSLIHILLSLLSLLDLLPASVSRTQSRRSNAGTYWASDAIRAISRRSPSNRAQEIATCHWARFSLRVFSSSILALREPWQPTVLRETCAVRSSRVRSRCPPCIATMLLASRVKCQFSGSLLRSIASCPYPRSAREHRKAELRCCVLYRRAQVCITFCPSALASLRLAWR
eukprot:scaffold4768_cov412-Prasinococcus_capsulatus_cf.AAC.27